MNGIDLPRGRATDALVALTAFGALLMLLPPVFAMATQWVFSPAMVLAAWKEVPGVAALSPLVSQFAAGSLFGAAFDAVLLLISGRYVERAVGPVGMVMLFAAGAYAGAVARLILTPGSVMPGFGANGAMFAVIGAYLALYGIPAGLPLHPRGGRMAQIGVLALIWAALQVAFILTAGGDWSIAIVEPLGGLAAGVALARPLLRWKYRKA